MAARIIRRRRLVGMGHSVRVKLVSALSPPTFTRAIEQLRYFCGIMAACPAPKIAPLNWLTYSQLFFIIALWNTLIGGASMAKTDKDGKPVGEGKVTITVRLPPDLIEAVDEMADGELRSRSSQIQKLLEESVPRQQAQPAPNGKK